MSGCVNKGGEEMRPMTLVLHHLLSRQVMSVLLDSWDANGRLDVTKSKLSDLASSRRLETSSTSRIMVDIRWWILDGGY